MLPTPPSDYEKYAYLGQNKPYTYFGIFTFLLLMIGMFLFTASFLWFLPLLLVYLVYLTVSYAVGVFGTEFDFNVHQVVIDGYKFAPTVDVFLPCCGEPMSLLENTYQNVAALRHPQASIRVYVLDDAGSTEVRALAEKYGFNYISRDDRGHNKKAGNLRHAFRFSSGEFILILDADFCPRTDMLEEMLPYFKYDPRIAIVQSPQFFEIKDGQNWLEKGAAHIQELFYRMIQVYRDTWGSAICVGTCALYRRAALQPFGGTYEIAHSEDLHTGFMLVNAGWRLHYVPVNLAKGVCPDNLRSFFNQQYRWCTGSTSLLTNSMFWNSGMSFWQKVPYLSGMIYYLASALSIFVTPLPAMFLLHHYPEKLLIYNSLFSIPSFLFGTFIVAIWSKSPWGWYAYVTKQVSYWAHSFALVDRMKKSSMGWLPTNAKGASQNSRYTGFVLLSIIWYNATLIYTFAGIVSYLQKGLPPMNLIPLVLFTGVNYSVLVYLVCTWIRGMKT